MKNKKSLDPLGEVLTKKEIKFLAELFYDAWYSCNIENLDQNSQKSLVESSNDETEIEKSVKPQAEIN